MAELLVSFHGFAQVQEVSSPPLSNSLKMGELVQPVSQNVPERLETGTSFFECIPNDKTGQHWFYSVESATPEAQYNNEYLNFLTQCTGQTRGPLEQSDPAVQNYLELRNPQLNSNEQSLKFSLPLNQFPIQGLQASSVS